MAVKCIFESQVLACDNYWFCEPLKFDLIFLLKKIYSLLTFGISRIF